ncbi:MAG: 2'-5' RNA ligase family protein [Chloroflexota bacterium]|nr:2'-5' RNA ligase family protein [Chloroflexota bacterium]
MSDSRFAVYLIPPYRVAQAVAEVHRLLRKQFGFIAAERFQVHATIKGFFKKTPSPLDELEARLDAVFAGQPPIPIEFSGYRCNPVGIGLDVSRLNGDVNPGLMALREQVVDAVRPFIAADCDFVARDLGDPFRAHITLAFRDIPPEMQPEVLAYLEQATLPSEPFLADTFHFLQFRSQDWSGAWQKTLTWQLLRSWWLKE